MKVIISPSPRVITRIGDISWVEISSCIGNVEKNDVLDLLEDLADEPCGGDDN